MTILQGEIWLVDLNPTIGTELNKQRPCVVVGDDSVGKLASKTVVPITGYNSVYEYVPWMIKIECNKENNLAKLSAGDTFQIRNLSKRRFIKKIGKIDKNLLFKIHSAVAKTLSVNYTLKP